MDFVPIPDDPKFLSRPTQTIRLLNAISSSSTSVAQMQITLSLLLAPPNLRYLLAVVDNFVRLHRQYPSSFIRLTPSQSQALNHVQASYVNASEVIEHGLISDIRRSPHGSGHGNLRYSSTRHPLYSLLMLEHPHTATSPYLDLIISEITAKAISLRSGFGWAAYAAYINPETREHATCPQPRNGSIENIERAIRQITGSLNIDLLSALFNQSVPLEIYSILDALSSLATKNSVSKEAVEIGRLVRNFLDSSATEYRGSNRSNLRRSFRNGLNYGTHRIGPFYVADSELDDVSLLSTVSDEDRLLAADLDIAPIELSHPSITMVIDLADKSGLTHSSKVAYARQVGRQVRRSQQLMPNRVSGLKAHRLSPVATLLAATSIDVSVHLLLLASLAIGRPLDTLSKISITKGACLDDPVEDVEYDLIRRAWRVRVNQPDLKNCTSPLGAKIVKTHAEIPDAVGAHRLALLLHVSDHGTIERATKPFTEAHCVEARVVLKTIKLREDFLCRILPLALYEATGDLSTGALISRWLPNDCETYLHYLSVDCKSLANNYLKGCRYLVDKFNLPLTIPLFDAEPAYVGMKNCPNDVFIKNLVQELVSELISHPLQTRADRAKYINLLSAYSLLYMTQGLGLRNWIDADPEIQTLPSTFDGLGLASFADKVVSAGHFRVIYCPADLTKHIVGLSGLTQRLAMELTATPGKEAPGLLPFIDEDQRVRRFHPADVRTVLGDRFPFPPNALRRRARSHMYDYEGSDAVTLAHGYSYWMGHWTYATNPHRIEADGLRESAYLITRHIIEPLIAADGWTALAPRI